MNDIIWLILASCGFLVGVWLGYGDGFKRGEQSGYQRGYLARNEHVKNA